MEEIIKNKIESTVQAELYTLLFEKTYPYGYFSSYKYTNNMWVAPIIYGSNNNGNHQFCINATRTLMILHSKSPIHESKITPEQKQLIIKCIADSSVDRNFLYSLSTKIIPVLNRTTEDLFCDLVNIKTLPLTKSKRTGRLLAFCSFLNTYRENETVKNCFLKYICEEANLLTREGMFCLIFAWKSYEDYLIKQINTQVLLKSFITFIQKEKHPLQLVYNGLCMLSSLYKNNKEFLSTHHSELKHNILNQYGTNIKIKEKLNSFGIDTEVTSPVEITQHTLTKINLNHQEFVAKLKKCKVPASLINTIIDFINEQLLSTYLFTFKLDNQNTAVGNFIYEFRFILTTEEQKQIHQKVFQFKRDISKLQEIILNTKNIREQFNSGIPRINPINFFLSENMDKIFQLNILESNLKNKPLPAKRIGQKI